MQSSCLWKQLRYLIFEVQKIIYALQTTVLCEVSGLANILEIDIMNCYQLYQTKILIRAPKAAST